VFNYIKKIIQNIYSEGKTTFGTVESPPHHANMDTKPLSPEDLKQVLLLKPKEKEPKQLIVSARQSVGMERDHNEDSIFSLTVNLGNNTGSTLFGFYIVADGMGGHLHGEIASATAVRSMSNHVIKELYNPLFGEKPSIPNESIAEILKKGVISAHESILEKTSGGGTTLTSIFILKSQMVITHVGDSRVYKVDNNGTMEILTRDHSLVNRLVELGQITTKEAAVHPQRNVLYRALGQGEPFEPDIITSPLPETGYLLICSDGLWGVVPKDKIGKTISDMNNPFNASKKLVELANAAGGPDNISVILIKLSN